MIKGRIKNKLVLTALISCLSTNVMAQMPEQCIQDPARRDACPRLIYKAADMPVVGTDQTERKIVCLCLADFQEILSTSKDEVQEKIKQQRFRSIAIKWGLTNDQLLDLIRYD